MAKYADDDDPQLRRLAEESFRRALAINTELSLAHYLYAQLEMEIGRPVEAFVRLLDRARERRADPQLFAGLVQACRYVGLIEASRASHTRAKQLDPVIKTSIAYTSMVAGNYAQAAAEARENDDPVEAIALALVGRSSEAVELLQDLHRRYGNNRVWAAYLDLALAFARQDRAALITHAETCLRLPFSDPEGVFQVCLLLALSGELGLAGAAFKRTIDAGFSCPAALDGHPMLRTLNAEPAFAPMRAEADRRHQQAVGALESVGGLAVLT